jgi:hypothetical protein
MNVWESETYTVELRRPRPWRSEATVFRFGPAQTEPEPLLTVQALTRRGAKRRAARFLALRERVAARG